MAGVAPPLEERVDPGTEKRLVDEKNGAVMPWGRWEQTKAEVALYLKLPGWG